MDTLIRWSIRYRVVVAALSLAWLIGGIVYAFTVPLDVFPEFVPPQVTIQTEAAGFAPEHVEQIITRPIEAAVNGAPGVDFDPLRIASMACPSSCSRSMRTWTP